MKKSKQLVTIYDRGDFQMSKLEGEFIASGNAGPNQQSPFVDYIPEDSTGTLQSCSARGLVWLS